MKRKFILAGMVVLLVGVVAAAAVMVQNGSAQQSNPATDPHVLTIPRWFLSGLTLDGKTVDVAAGQQKLTLQFTPDGSANGIGSCNSFGGSYQAGADGKLHFGPLAATLMACADGMDQENAYFSALAKVEQFQVVDGKLSLSSADNKTVLIFARPPK